MNFRKYIYFTILFLIVISLILCCFQHSIAGLFIDKLNLRKNQVLITTKEIPLRDIDLIWQGDSSNDTVTNRLVLIHKGINENNFIPNNYGKNWLDLSIKNTNYKGKIGFFKMKYYSKYKYNILVEKFGETKAIISWKIYNSYDGIINKGNDTLLLK